MISKSINKAQDRIKRNFDDKDFLELFKKGGVAMLFRIGGQLLGFLLTFVIAYFFGANGLEGQMKRGFEKSAALLQQHGVSNDPYKLTTLAYYEALEVVKEQIKKSKKKR